MKVSSYRSTKQQLSSTDFISPSLDIQFARQCPVSNTFYIHTTLYNVLRSVNATVSRFNIFKPGQI